MFLKKILLTGSSFYSCLNQKVRFSEFKSLAIMDQCAIKYFQQYLRIPTITLQKPDYLGVESFLRNSFGEIGLQFRRVDQESDLGGKRPIFIGALIGKDPSLPALLLNSHFDVVPVEQELWKYDPFGAEMTSDGRIYARGAQDMKCVTIQYLQAISRIISYNACENRSSPFLRTLYICATPDEEIGGFTFRRFVASPAFKELNIGYALDEGIASPNDTYRVFIAERISSASLFTIPGKSGHGSLFVPDTAGEKLRRLLDAVYDFRESEYKRRQEGTPEGCCSVANVTVISGGSEDADNLTPSSVSVLVDMRNAPQRTEHEVRAQLDAWCRAAGAGVRYEMRIGRYVEPRLSAVIDTQSQPASAVRLADRFWHTFARAIEAPFEPEVFPACTDGRYLREAGVPVVGFSPMRRTPALLHCHDEYLPADVFLEGIRVYERLLPALANLPPT